jgi:hypothetical protein
VVRTGLKACELYVEPLLGAGVGAEPLHQDMQSRPHLLDGLTGGVIRVLELM